MSLKYHGIGASLPLYKYVWLCLQFHESGVSLPLYKYVWLCLQFHESPSLFAPLYMHKKLYSLSPFNSKQKIIHSTSVIWADFTLNRLREMSEQVYSLRIRFAY